MKKIIISIFLGLFLFISCKKETPEVKPEATSDTLSVKKTTDKKVIADAATILSKKEVPILCYHNIREFKSTASDVMKTNTVKPAAFAEQMKTLSEAGYHTILPEQLYDYLVFDGKLPEKPIMITFDDTRVDQYNIGAVEMKKYGFKGVFFVMTVAINRPGYMTKEEIKTLSDEGHVIASHTWDHHMVTKYADEDWNTQFVKPKAKLEAIIGKPVTDFAYPFGLWNTAAIPELKKSGHKMAYILSTKRDSIDPLYTIRRIIISGTSSPQRMLKSIESSFK